MMATESGTVRMTRYDPNTQKDGAEISVTASSYADNPVWFRKTFDLDDGRKVGYICYGSFNYHFDDKLIDAFREFKNEQISELVVDLRYNGGGHVVSSTVLGTLVAGSKHSGEVYARTTYNADRKSETPDVYKLGVAQYNESNSNARHSKIAEALDSSVGLDRIFVLCTGNTASASELLVNGLRGLGVEVNLIGLTTNGKNVGMEPQKKCSAITNTISARLLSILPIAKAKATTETVFNPMWKPGITRSIRTRTIISTESSGATYCMTKCWRMLCCGSERGRNPICPDKPLRRAESKACSPVYFGRSHRCVCRIWCCCPNRRSDGAACRGIAKSGYFAYLYTKYPDFRMNNDQHKFRFIPEVGRGCGFCNSEAECQAQMADGCFKLHETPWLAGYPTQTTDEIVEVRFKNTRRSFYINATGQPLHSGDIVAVEAQPGHDIGVVSLTGDLVARQMRRTGFNPYNGEYKKVYRKAKPYDIERWQEAIALEHETMIASRQIAADMGLNMKIGDVEYQGDKIKAIFYYIADERVDFRELIKVFAERFHIRIEMKQIGARQEAGRIGGLGACGRELCCASWMSSFSSVTTGAARAQDISLNPQKLAGQCSKLKCCMMYEYDTYVDARKAFPRLREPLQTIDGEYFW